MADLVVKFESYEPMRNNRWLLEIEDQEKIKPYFIQKSSRPKFYRTKWWKIWRRFEIDDVQITTVEPIGNEISDYFYNKINKDGKITFTITMLDPTGVPVEKWKIRDCKINVLDFGELNYADDSLSLCNLIVKPKSVEKLI
jgi:hypothetical protein